MNNQRAAFNVAQTVWTASTNAAHEVVAVVGWHDSQLTGWSAYRMAEAYAWDDFVVATAPADRDLRVAFTGATAAFASSYAAEVQSAAQAQFSNFITSTLDTNAVWDDFAADLNAAQQTWSVGSNNAWDAYWIASTNAEVTRINDAALADSALSTTATLVDGNWTASENAAAATRQSAINTAYHTYADSAGEADKTLATTEATAAKTRDLAQDTALTTYEQDTSQNAVDKQSAQWTATKTYTPVQVNAARDWAKAVKDAAAYLKQNLNAAEAALLDGVAAIIAEKDEVFKTIDGNTHVDVAKVRQDAAVQKWAATLAAHQGASESTFAGVELQRPALVQTAMDADANSSRATGFFAGIEQGLNDLTGGDSRRILLSPEFTAALNAIDGFFAGVADSLTAGLSTRLRSFMWGEAATQNHDGPWFTAGQITGAILSVPLMAASPCSLGAVFGVGLRVLNGIQLVGNGISAVENIAAGNYLSAGMNVLGMVANLNQLRRACFTGEMQVKTKRGWVRWDALLPTDEVLSCDEHDPHGELSYKPIETLLQTEAEIWHVHVNGKVIRTTAEHPFYVWDKGWVAARDLHAGDLLRSEDGQVIRVDEVFDTGTVETVYNCSVAEYHTYFVGSEDWDVAVWAHNACYDVGLAKDLRRTSQRGTQVNHAPQSREAELLMGRFNPRNNVGNEPAIRLPISEHEAVSAAQNARSATASARDLLASEIRILRANTNAPNSALRDLIRLNREVHPFDYLPLHRM